ncbi:MAG: alkaline phosphatase family protein [Phycisphaerae bacterium]|nr:alkaline phosphatase family protein [Phycisphaerae bacterium]
MSQSVAVILVVGLNRSLITDAAPNLKAFVNAGTLRTLEPVLPAVTCSVQSSMLTGRDVCDHGVVANGWYNHDMAEIQFWKQSNKLVEGEKVWDAGHRMAPAIQTLNMFWWYNMNTTADYSVTPRPMYKADGRKIPDCYSQPGYLRDELQERLGTFPLFNFWGPATSIKSSRWIADATMHCHEKLDPGLTLVYLPHLDYGLQKLGPDHPEIPQHVAEVDAVVGELIDYFTSRSVTPIIVSEYGIEPVDTPIPINRHLREAGGIAVRKEQGLELLDPSACGAFAVADHQIAHVYVKDPSDLGKYRTLCSHIEGVDAVYDKAQQASLKIGHPRSGDLVCVAAKGCWFSYYYWLDDAVAPDFARCVDIHRKPGYDPGELFLDPAIKCPKLKIAAKLLKKKLGFRTLMDVIPLDGSLVKGSHGRTSLPEELSPVIIAPNDLGAGQTAIPCQQVYGLILNQLR